jgi:hypothetical protein
MDNNKQGKTAVIEARLDYATMASIHKWLHSVGATPQTKSELIWMATESLLNLLAKNGQCTKFQTITEAYDYLHTMGMSDLWHGGRGKRAAVLQMQMESVQLENDVVYNNNTQTAPNQQSLKSLDDGEIQKAIKDAIMNICS